MNGGFFAGAGVGAGVIVTSREKLFSPVCRFLLALARGPTIHCGFTSFFRDYREHRLPESHLGLNRSSGLVDVLDRILEKGLVVAGDVKISLAEVELLTIRIRLIICSIDKAQAIGLDWWKGDRYFSAQGQDGHPALPAPARAVATPTLKSPRRRATRNPERRGRTSANGPSRRRGGE